MTDHYNINLNEILINKLKLAVFLHMELHEIVVRNKFNILVTKITAR